MLLRYYLKCLCTIDFDNSSSLSSSAEDTVKDLYSDLKSGILRFGKDIEVRPKKHYISYRHNNAFVGFIFLKSKLKAYLNIQLSHLHDPLKNGRDVTKIGNYPHGATLK